MNEVPGTKSHTPVLTVTLAGRQNSGKTSLSMQLTGKAQKPVNFPGSSVDRSESLLHTDGRTLRIVDLPGISSLTPISRDEQVATDFLKQGSDSQGVICAVLDASKISVELRLLHDLYSLGSPIVVALNKNDVARAKGHAVYPAQLATELGLPVIETNGFKGSGTDALLEALLAAEHSPPPSAAEFDPDLLANKVQATTVAQRSRTAALDRILLHKWFGPLVLATVILGTFQLVFTVAEPFMDMVESGQNALAGWVGMQLPSGALRSFVTSGLINGLGSVLVFLPQIILLIALVTMLEGSGYLARAAFILDRALNRVGLSGRSFLPLTSSFACAIPGILAARIIDNERDRLATIAVAPLMSCSARLPVYVVLIGAFFPVQYAGLVLFGLYALGIIVAVLVAFILRATLLRGGRSFLVMELPPYQWPSWKVIGSQVTGASREFLVLAGSVILATSIIIWVTSYYPRPASIHADFEQQRQDIDSLELTTAGRAVELRRIDRREQQTYFEQSYLAQAGKAVQPAFAPAGFDWRTTVSILAAFPARELVIPTLGILHSLGDIDPGDFDLANLDEEVRPGGLRAKLQNAKDPDGRPAFNSLVALALMVFFALCSQCAATLGTIRRETRSWRWPLFTFGYMTALAWCAAVLVYQVGKALGYGL